MKRISTKMYTVALIVVGLSILGDAAALPVTPPAPTVTGISPTSGTTGTSLTITGTNLTGAIVFVCGIAASVQSSTDTTLVVTVPAGATGVCDVVVMTPDRSVTVTATAQFTVTGPSTFARSVTLNLSRHLLVRGFVISSGSTGCDSYVDVRIQRERVTGWRTVARDTTFAGGRYLETVPDRVGRYRTVAPKLELSSGDVCVRAVSNVTRNGRVLWPIKS
jgi:hypothetical protein